ncbi:hypothetical protein MIR68_001030 [Amoeboaphelidium protococcarum]|nr:hypothetical protein MIR68_001030 [Amoeboaphelidium protococcarum]
MPVKLRSYQDQMALRRTSFDLKDFNGLVTPVEPRNRLTIPNEMSLRPASDNMLELLKFRREEPHIYMLKGGMTLPEGLRVYDTILRVQVRNSYFKFYGPVLAMFRVKLHPYLQLKTVEDFQFFMHKDLVYDSTLHMNSLGCMVVGDREVVSWNKAIWTSFSDDDRLLPNVCGQVTEWQEIYVNQIVHRSLIVDQPLAVSQVDLLITVFVQSVMNWKLQSTAEVTDDLRTLSINRMSVLKYGYFYEAVNKIDLLQQALVGAINEYFISVVGLYYSGPVILPDEVIQPICWSFSLGRPLEVLQRFIDEDSDIAPSFGVIQAYIISAKELDMYDQLDKEVFFKTYIIRMVKYYSSSTTQSDDITNLRRRHRDLCINDSLKSELCPCISYEWVGQQFEYQDSILSVEYCWIMIELFVATDKDRALLYLLQKLAEKINRGLVDEAANLLIAITSSQCIRQDINRSFDINLYKCKYKDVMREVLLKLVNNIFIVRNAEHYWLSMAFQLFQSMLIDDLQWILPRFLLAFSKAHEFPQEANGCSNHLEVIRTLEDSLGGRKSFLKFAKSLNAETLAQYNECVLAVAFGNFSYKQLTAETEQLFGHLIQLFAEVGDPKQIATFFNRLYFGFVEIDLNKMVKASFSFDMLKLITAHLMPDTIEDLKLGDEYHQEWMQKMKQAEQQLQFPDNIVQVARIAYANYGRFVYSSCYVGGLIERLIASSIVMPLEQRKSRFYFFEGLPYFVMKEQDFFEQYIRLWKDQEVLNDRDLVPDESELVRGFFNYVHSDKVPIGDRHRMIKRFAFIASCESLYNDEDSMAILINEYGYPTEMKYYELF